MPFFDPERFEPALPPSKAANQARRASPLPRRFRNLLLGLGRAIVLLGTLLHAGVAWGEEQVQKAAAELLFDQGKRLLLAGDYEPACRKLAESLRIDPGIGTLFYLAQCYEKLGRTASAWATFREAVSAAQAAGQFDRAQRGRERAAALEPFLSTLTLKVGEQERPRGFTVKQDRERVASSLLGAAVPIDPGQHRIHAEAPGYLPWSQVVEVPANAAIVVTIPELNPDSDASLGRESRLENEPDAKAPSSPELARPLADPGKNQRTWAWVLGGAAVASAGVGVAFGLDARAKDRQADQVCLGVNCWETRGEDRSRDARASAAVANIAFGFSAAALVGSVVVYLTAPKPQPSRAAALTFTGVLRPDLQGVSVSHGF